MYVPPGSQTLRAEGRASASCAAQAATRCSARRAAPGRGPSPRAPSRTARCSASPFFPSAIEPLASRRLSTTTLTPPVLGAPLGCAARTRRRNVDRSVRAVHAWQEFFEFCLSPQTADGGSCCSSQPFDPSLSPKISSFLVYVGIVLAPSH